MSAYANDQRVTFNADSSATVPGGVHGDWLVWPVDVGDWWASHPEYGHLRDLTDGRYPARYATCDEVLAHLLGPANVPV